MKKTLILFLITIALLLSSMMAFAVPFPYVIYGQTNPNEQVILKGEFGTKTTVSHSDGYYQFDLSSDYSSAEFTVKGCSLLLALPRGPAFRHNYICNREPVPVTGILITGASIIAAGAAAIAFWRKKKIRCTGKTKEGKPCKNYFPCKVHPNLTPGGK